MENIFKILFQREKPVTTIEMKKALQEVERDRARKKIEMERTRKNSEKLFEDYRTAIKSGDKLQEEWLLNDYKNTQTEYKMLYSEARRHNLEGITLKNYVRLMEFAEKSKHSVSSIIEKIKKSKLGEMIDNAKVNEKEYISMLQEEVDSIASELGYDMGENAYTSPEDNDIREAALAANKLEDEGKFDELEEHKQKELNKRMFNEKL